MQRSHAVQARVECMHLAGKMPFMAMGQAHQLNPMTSRRIGGHDLGRAIGRAVVNDHPPFRQDGLGDDRIERLANERLLIACRGNEHELQMVLRRCRRPLGRRRRIASHSGL